MRSSASSSAMRMVMESVLSRWSRCMARSDAFLRRNSQNETRAVTRCALGVDGSAVALRDLLHDGEANAGALVLRPTVQAVKWQEHAFGVLDRKSTRLNSSHL